MAEGWSWFNKNSLMRFKLFFWEFLLFLYLARENLAKKWPCDYIIKGRKYKIYYLIWYNHRVTVRMLFVSYVYTQICKLILGAQNLGFRKHIFVRYIYWLTDLLYNIFRNLLMSDMLIILGIELISVHHTKCNIL